MKRYNEMYMNSSAHKMNVMNTIAIIFLTPGENIKYMHKNYHFKAYENNIRGCSEGPRISNPGEGQSLPWSSHITTNGKNLLVRQVGRKSMVVAKLLISSFSNSVNLTC